jgi:hypothetical protein
MTSFIALLMLIARIALAGSSGAQSCIVSGTVRHLCSLSRSQLCMALTVSPAKPAIAMEVLSRTIQM